MVNEKPIPSTSVLKESSSSQMLVYKLFSEIHTPKVPRETVVYMISISSLPIIKQHTDRTLHLLLFIPKLWGYLYYDKGYYLYILCHCYLLVCIFSETMLDRWHSCSFFWQPLTIYVVLIQRPWLGIVTTISFPLLTSCTMIL